MLIKKYFIDTNDHDPTGSNITYSRQYMYTSYITGPEIIS